ncbi:hypothetical protein B0H14DRAFT_2719864, partial [Mycena olivaceomarginata]
MLLAIARTAFVAPAHFTSLAPLPHLLPPRALRASLVASHRLLKPSVHATGVPHCTCRLGQSFPITTSASSLPRARPRSSQCAPPLTARHRRLCTPWCSLRHHPCPQRAPLSPAPHLSNPSPPSSRPTVALSCTHTPLRTSPPAAPPSAYASRQFHLRTPPSTSSASWSVCDDGPLCCSSCAPPFSSPIPAAPADRGLINI